MKNLKPYRGFKIKLIDSLYCCPAIGEYNHPNRVAMERAIYERIQLKKEYLVEQGKIELNG